MNANELEMQILSMLLDNVNDQMQGKIDKECTFRKSILTWRIISLVKQDTTNTLIISTGQSSTRAKIGRDIQARL